MTSNGQLGNLIVLLMPDVIVHRREGLPNEFLYHFGTSSSGPRIKLGPITLMTINKSFAQAHPSWTRDGLKSPSMIGSPGRQKSFLSPTDTIINFLFLFGTQDSIQFGKFRELNNKFFSHQKVVHFSLRKEVVLAIIRLFDGIFSPIFCLVTRQPPTTIT